VTDFSILRMGEQLVPLGQDPPRSLNEFLWASEIVASLFFNTAGIQINPCSANEM
jgi:hypothetical protein